MRRKEKEIKDKREIESIINRALYCRIGLSDDSMPYVVPVNFGYKDNTFYFHSAKQGKKIQILEKNNRICFQLDLDTELIRSGPPCKWSTRYLSVIAYGVASVIDDYEEKKAALDIIVNRYGGYSRDYSEESLHNMVVIKADIVQMTGKKSGY